MIQGWMNLNYQIIIIKSVLSKRYWHGKYTFKGGNVEINTMNLYQRYSTLNKGLSDDK